MCVIIVRQKGNINMIVDFLGRELKIGDTVVYAAKYSPLEKGIITDMFIDNFGRKLVKIDTSGVNKLAEISVVKIGDDN